MHSTTHHSSRSQMRFYIVMITLVLGGITFLLLLNNDGQDFNFTSAIIGDTPNEVIDKEVLQEVEAEAYEQEIEKVFSKEIEKDSKEVELAISFDKVPKVKERAKLQELEIRFEDLSTTINVNEDRLELNNLEEVTLRISGFNGEVDFNEDGFSLDGMAKRIEVNGVAFSSSDKLAIMFNDLDYKAFYIAEIALDELEMDKGNGILNVGTKLSYALEEDELKVFSFIGSLDVDKEYDSTNVLVMEGTSQGLKVSGKALDFNIW